MSEESTSSCTKSASSSNVKPPEPENPCQLECDPIYVFQGRLRIKFIDASYGQNLKTVMDLLVKFSLMGIGAVTLFWIFGIYFLDDCYPHLTFHSEKVAHGYLCAFAMQFWLPFAYLLVSQFNGTSRGWKKNHLMWTFAILKFIGTSILFFGVSSIFFENHLRRSPADELVSDPTKPISTQARCETDNMSVITVYEPPMWLTFYDLPVSHYLFGLLATTFAILDLTALFLLALPESEKSRNYAVSGMFLLNIPFVICNGFCLLFLSFYLLKNEWNQKFLNFAGLFNIFLVLLILFDILTRKFAPDYLYKRDCKIIKPNRSDIMGMRKQGPRKVKKKKKEDTTKSKKKSDEDELSISSSGESSYDAINEVDPKAIERSTKHIERAQAKQERIMRQVEQAIEKAKAVEARGHELAIKELEKAKEKKIRDSEKAKQTISRAQEKARRKMENAENICDRAINRARVQGERDLSEAERAYMKITGMKPPRLDEQGSSTSLNS